MTDEEELLAEEPRQSEFPGRKRKYPWAMIVVIFLFILIPFLSWYGSWFGRPLSDSQIQSYLQDREKPRNIQHALSLIGNKIIEGDAAMQKWYPAVMDASQNEAAEVRKVAAWTMGQDNKYDGFHQALLELLKDENAGVRHNAAVQLVRFNDASGRAELRSMLEATPIKASSDGEVELIISEEGIAVAANTPLIRLKQNQRQTIEIRATENARIQSVMVTNNATVKAGDVVMILSPSVEQAFEALKALYIVGQEEDIPVVQRYTGQMPGMADAVNKQALSTLAAIRSRVGHP